MTFPHYFHLFGYAIHPHPVMEVIGYSGGFQIYLRSRKRWPSAHVEIEQSLWLIVGAIFGALVGAKLLAWLESVHDFGDKLFRLEVILNGKTIVGGLLGGWIGVEIAKRVQHIRHSTGDAFIFPLIFGMAVGRVGCFLTGVSDHTHGLPSSLPWAVDEGDGIRRHPTQLYDIVFLSLLALALLLRLRLPTPNGQLFRLFLLCYLLWRFCIEFVKPRYTYWDLSAIQVACALGAMAVGWQLLFVGRSRGEALLAVDGPERG